MLERLEQARLAQDEATAAKLRPSKEELDALGGRSQEIFAVPLHMSLVDNMQVSECARHSKTYYFLCAKCCSAFEVHDPLASYHLPVS